MTKSVFICSNLCDMQYFKVFHIPMLRQKDFLSFPGYAKTVDV